MPPVVIDVRAAEDSRDVVHRAVQALCEGQLVAFPTETVYGLAASALKEEGVARLQTAKGRQARQPLALAIKGADDALDYVPDMVPLARRLARRCWPGPVTLVVDDQHPDSVLGLLPPAVREAVLPEGTIGLRVPANNVLLDVLRMLPGPLVLTSANRHGQAPAITAQEVAQTFGDEVPLVLDDGRCRFGQPSSVVRVRGGQLELLRAGVVSEQNLKRLSSLVILFVCTGNTCRSPMAEALCKKLLAERLGCALHELEDRGVIVGSAGIAAMMGGRASPEAVEVLAAEGLNLEEHYSQPVTDTPIRQADQIVCMTRSHRHAILAEWPQAADRTRLLARDGSDIADPIGGTPEQYRRCAEQIREELVTLIDQLPL